MKRGLTLLCTALCLGCLPEVMVAQPRYFAPPPPELAPVELPLGTLEAPLLRLRRVRAGSHLQERMVWRRSQTEFGFHELLRWTQSPADLVEQWVSRELFERRALRRALAGPTPLLQIEVLAFDEVLLPERRARVELTARLSDARGIALLERTYVAEEPVEGRDGAALARAMGVALGVAIERLGSDAVQALTAAAG